MGWHSLRDIRGIEPLTPSDPYYPRHEPQPQQSIRNSLFDEAAGVHEAAHAVFAYYNNQQIHDISIHGQGLGGGEFRNVPHASDLPEPGTKEAAGQQISLMTA